MKTNQYPFLLFLAETTNTRSKATENGRADSSHQDSKIKGKYFPISHLTFMIVCGIYMTYSSIEYILQLIDCIRLYLPSAITNDYSYQFIFAKLLITSEISLRINNLKKKNMIKLKCLCCCVFTFLWWPEFPRVVNYKYIRRIIIAFTIRIPIPGKVYRLSEIDKMKKKNENKKTL